MLRQTGRIEHHPIDGTMFMGCQIRKLGLATVEVQLPTPDALLLVEVAWPTHTVMVVDKGDRLRHIVTYGPPGRPHVSPAVPFSAAIYQRA